VTPRRCGPTSWARTYGRGEALGRDDQGSRHRPGVIGRRLV
jgi:hypothetical protein